MVLHHVDAAPPALSTAQVAALGKLDAQGQARPEGCNRPRYVQRETLATLVRLGLVEAVQNDPAPARRRRVAWTTYRLTEAGRSVASQAGSIVR